MPDSLVIMCIGQFLIGGFSVFFVITCLPEMIKDAVEGNPDKQLEVTDISSGVFNCMLGSGQMLGPIYGSFISNAFNFRLLADSVAWSLICFSLAYFAVCNGYQALKNQKQIPLSLSCQAGEQELSSSISLEECLRNRKDSQVF